MKIKSTTSLLWVWVCAMMVVMFHNTIGCSDKEIVMTTFNIRDFGATKAGRPSVMSVLAQIISRSDAVFIQELSQTPPDPPASLCGNYTASAICDLRSVVEETRRILEEEKRIKRRGDDNDEQNPDCLSDLVEVAAVSASPRSGTGGYAEQYALIYDPRCVSVESVRLVEDPDELWKRPPAVYELVHTPTGAQLVGVISHTSPKAARTEIAALGTVLSELSSTHDLAFIAGDLNADGSYFKEADWEKFWASFVGAGEGFGQEIATGVVTTVSATSKRTYDRVITTPQLHQLVTYAAPFYFDNETLGGYSMNSILDAGCGVFFSEPCSEKKAAGAVSDHYPVEFVFDLSSLYTGPQNPDKEDENGDDENGDDENGTTGAKSTNIAAIAIAITVGLTALIVVVASVAVVGYRRFFESKETHGTPTEMLSPLVDTQTM